MYHAMERAVSLLFEPLPFSRENEEREETILTLAKQNYEEMLQGGSSPVKAAGDFLIHADTVEGVSAYLGERGMEGSNPPCVSCEGTDAYLEERGIEGSNPLRVPFESTDAYFGERKMEGGNPLCVPCGKTDLGDGTVLGKGLFQNVQKKLRRNSYALAFVLALWFNSAAALLLNLPVFLGLPLAQSLPSFGVVAAEWAVFGLLARMAVKKRKEVSDGAIQKYGKQEEVGGQTQFFQAAFACSCRELARKKYDLYTKKLLNTLFGVFSIGFILFFSVALALVSYQYSLTEVLNTINFYLSFIFLAGYLTLKNYFCRKQYADFFCGRKGREYGQELRRVSACSAAYYLFFLVVLLVLRNRTEHIFSFGIAAVAGYFVLAIFYNMTRRRRFVGRNLVLNVKKACCYGLVGLSLVSYHFMKLDLFLLQPYINTVSEVGYGEPEILYDKDTGVYTLVAQEDHFRILQLTDIHLGGSILSVVEDTKALTACYRLIQETQPDLVAVTGDLVFPMGIMSFSFNNNAPIMQFANFMRNVGIPWVFTYGNHDTESLATLDRAEVDKLLKSLSYKTSKNLLYPYVQPDVYGRSNQMVEIRASDGKLMQALFLIDSNDYVEAGGINEYDYIHDDQVEWYRRMVEGLSKREGEQVPSMVFTHIPLQEYKEANELYEAGSDEVTYFYGELGEKMIDKICCSKYKSKLFDTAVELGSTQAIFCGHDHYNNQSLEYKGIRLTYGYSIDYLAMPGIEDDTEQRGATLVTVGKDGEYQIEPYRLVDLPAE